MNIIAKSIHGRITQHGTDYLGRWSYVRLATKQQSMIYIITAYKPCKNSINKAGPMTVFRQQWTLLRRQGCIDPKPREQFDTDLTSFLTSIQQQQHRIVLIGDFNERKEKSKLFQTLYNMGLRDMICDRHQQLPAFRTCLKGKNIIDYGMCSISLLPHISLSTYEPFYLGIQSDHRGIVIDFDNKGLFGPAEHLSTPTQRCIKSGNDQQQQQFLQHLTEYWKKFDIANRLKQATQIIDNQPKLRKMLNDIDSDVTTAMLQSEKKTQQRQRAPWSPELQYASLQVKFYKLHLTQARQKMDLSKAIQHTTTLMHNNATPSTPSTLQECQRLLRRAQKTLRRIRRQALEKRTEHLETLAAKYKFSGESDKAKIIKRIQKAEAIARCYKKLRWILHPPKPGVTFIQQPDNNGTIQTLYDRQQIEQAILERNQKHFNQCAGTPFTVPPLKSLSWAADSILAEQILQGEYNIPEVTDDSLLQKVLSNCKRLCNEQLSTIQQSDLTGLFKNWNEATTTSPSGRHLGLYKTIFLNPPETDTTTIQNNITTIINTLVQNGIGLNRWRKVVNMMIHKLEGSYLINKLRVIHLFEADYNGTIGLLFNRKLLYHAELHNLLNNNQWGCRPHRQAEDVLMLKELTYNLARTTKTTLATFDNDATGCFDRVPCTMAMLASRRVGADRNMCRLQADTLQHIQHKLRTAFGISNSFYTSHNNIEIHGQGQGSRAGPPTWVFVSSLLLDCMEQLASGVSFCCPLQQLQHTRHNDAFVDDVTGYSNQFLEELQGNNVIDKVVANMQNDATLWNDLLHISGGKLALHKCLYYVYTWQWSHGHASPLPTNQIHPKITLTPADDQPQQIKHVECDTAHRTLGQMKCPTGDQSAQLTYMKQRSNTWLAAIKESSLSRAEAQVAFDTIWFPSLAYGLSTTNLSYKELDDIQRPIVHHILPLLGYNRHFPRAVVYGSPRFGGLNFKHLYVEQGVQHVTQFIKYYRANNSIGNLLRISLRWMRHIAGFSYCPLLRPQPTYHHIQDRWFQTLIVFLYECNGYIETNDKPSIYSRQEDSSLMEDFLLFEPSKTQLLLLNQCRLYLRVTTLSDIATNLGTEIQRHFWDGSRPNNTTKLWPRQNKPSPNAWRIWRQFIARCYLFDDENRHPKRTDLQLQYPLGQWYSSHRTLQQRDYYFNPASQTIYHRQSMFYNIFHPYRNNRSTIQLRLTGRTTYLPPSSYPISPAVTSNTNIVLSKQHINNQYHEKRPNNPHSFSSRINSLEHWECSLLQSHKFYNHDTITVAGLTNQPHIIATDGSENTGIGSFGWIICSHQGEILASGSGLAYGLHISSFRCEAYAILAALRFIIQLRQHHQLPSFDPHITWLCDCKSLLQRITTALSPIPNPNRTKLAEHDTEIAIAHSFRLVSSNLHQKHIHSHQNDNIPLHSLPLPQKLNRMADSLAKDHAKTTNHATTTTPLISLAGCQLSINHSTITRSIPRYLAAAYSQQASINHIRRRLELPTNIHHLVAWKEFSRALLSFSVAHQRTIRRWIYGFLPTQKRLFRYMTCPSPLCPRCRRTTETDNHLLKCGGDTDWHDHLFTPLERLCHKHTISPWIETHLTKNLRNYLNSQPPLTDTNNIDQHLIGWSAAFYGIFSTQWITLQNNYNPSRPNGSSVLTSIIKLIFRAIIQRWHHRNQTLHSNSHTTPELHQRVICQVRGLYACCNDVLPSDRQIFSVPLELMIQKPTRTLQLFVEQNKDIVKQSVKLQQRTLQRQHRDIASYFIKIQQGQPAVHTQVTLGN